jgi:hypothetical protein
MVKTDLRDEAAVRTFLQQYDIAIDAASYSTVVDPVHVMRRQQSEGGTAPMSVKRAVEELSSTLHERRRRLTATAFKSTTHSSVLFRLQNAW